MNILKKNSLGNGALTNSMLSSEVDKAISKPKRNKEYLAWNGIVCAILKNYNTWIVMT